MAWNQKTYDQGVQDARERIEKDGVSAAWLEYEALDGARSVNEYEVGFRKVLDQVTSMMT